MLSFLRARAIAGMEVVTDEDYARTFAVGVAQGTVRVRPAAGNMLAATVRATTPVPRRAIAARLHRLFDLAADPLAIAAHLTVDPRLAPRVAARPGLRVPGAWDRFELAIRAILGQQISVAAARQLAGRLVVRYGDRLPSSIALDGLTHVFPRPAQLAAAPRDALGMPRLRARALIALAAAAAADRALFRSRPSLADTVSQLRRLPGVGEWTAQYIALRALRHPDAFPAGDVALQRALADRRGRRPTALELLARAEGWRPWRAYAAQHLWTSAADGPPAPDRVTGARPRPALRSGRRTAAAPSR